MILKNSFKIFFILILIVIPIGLLAQPDEEEVPPEQFNIDWSFPLPNYSAVEPEVIIYEVPLLALSHSGARGVVTRAQLGCGQFYSGNFSDKGLYKIIEFENKFGVINYFDTIVPMKWDGIECIYPDKTKNYIVKKGSKFGVINDKDSLVYEVSYDSITPVSGEKYRCEHHLELLKFYKDDQVGIGNLEGKWIIKPKKETIELLYHRWHCPRYYAMYKVGKNGMFGIRDDQDSLYLPIIYNKIFDYEEIEIPQKSHYSQPNDVILKAQKSDSLFVFNRKKIIHRSVFEEVKSYGIGSDYSHYAFKKNGKWGVVRKEEEIIANRFDEISIKEISPAFYHVKLNDLFGIIDSEGKEIVPVKFRTVKRLGDSCFQVKFNNFINLYDTHGNLLVQNGVEEITRLKDHVMLLKGRDGYGLFNTHNKKMIGDFNHDYPSHLVISTGIFDFDIFDHDFYFSLSKNGKYGAFDINGKQLFPYSYQKPIKLNTSGELMYFHLETTDSIYHVIKDEKVMVFPVGEEISYRFWDKDLLVVSKDGKKGLRNKDGDVILPTEFTRIFIDAKKSDTLYMATLKDSTLNFHQNSVKMKTIIVDLAFQSRTEDIHTRTGDLRGKINIKGEWLLEPRLETYKVLPNGVKIGLNRTNRYSFFDKYNKRMDAHQYSWVMVQIDGMIQCSRGRGKGIVDSLGKEVVPFVHQKIKVYDSIYAAKKSGYYGLFDKDGKRLTEYSYTKVKYQYRNMVCVRKGHRFAVVDLNGKELLPPISFYKIDLEELVKSGKYMITTETGKKFINSKFEVIEP